MTQLGEGWAEWRLECGHSRAGRPLLGARAGGLMVVAALGVGGVGVALTGAGASCANAPWLCRRRARLGEPDAMTVSDESPATPRLGAALLVQVRRDGVLQGLWGGGRVTGAAGGLPCLLV